VLNMKLIALGITAPRDGADPVILTSASDLSSFSFFQRGTMAQFVTFSLRQFTKSAAPGTRATVPHEGHMIHVYVRADGLGATCMVDAEYPDRVAFTLLSAILDEFTAKYQDKWRGESNDNSMPLPSLEAQLAKYQNPAEADKLMAIQKDLDQTTAIMHDTIEAALDRGVKLDELIEKSEDLSSSSKMFYKTAKKQNQCCYIM